MTTLCRTCRANPPATEGLCLVCLRDKLAADKDRRHREDVANRRRRRRVTPRDGHPWRASIWEKGQP
jgi:hypothetical protein